MQREEIWLLSVSLLLALGIRLFLIFTYQPLYGNDSPSYATLAEMIRTGDFSGYNGVRTPGYPLFMLILGMNNHVIRMVQNVAGLLSIWLVYLLVRPHVSKVAAWGLVLLMATSIQFPFYEAIIQTEALAMLAVLGSLYFFVMPSRRICCRMIMAASIASIGALVRPHLIILPMIYLVLYVWENRRDTAQVLKGIVSIALPSVLLIGGWVMFNYVTISRATFSTLPRKDVIAHVINYIEDADDKFGLLKDAYVIAYKTMRNRVEQTDDNRSFYTAYAGELLREWGVSASSELSDDIYDMAIDIIRKHPLGYLCAVMKAWLRFWRVHIIVYPECFSQHSSWFVLAMRVWLPTKVLWLGINSLFLLFLPVWPFLWMPASRRRFLFALYSVALAASFSQSLTQYYDNARFAVPFQPIVAIAVTVVVSTLFSRSQTVARSGTDMMT